MRLGIARHPRYPDRGAIANACIAAADSRRAAGAFSPSNEIAQLLRVTIFQLIPIEAPDYRTFHRATFAKECRIRALRGPALVRRLTRIVRDLAPSLGNFRERWNTLAAKPSAPNRSGVQPLDRCRAHRRDPAASVGSAVDGRIMNHHDFAIASHPHVELTHIGAKLSAAAMNAHKVFSG